MDHEHDPAKKEDGDGDDGGDCHESRYNCQ